MNYKALIPTNVQHLITTQNKNKRKRVVNPTVTTEPLTIGPAANDPPPLLTTPIHLPLSPAISHQSFQLQVWGGRAGVYKSFS